MTDNDQNGNKSTTSQRKIEANRRNALSSTGPKTEAGKKAVSGNALKHGIFSAKELVVPGHENLREFETLLEQLKQELRPEGMLEDIQVKEIAYCYWRLRRVIRCESGEIRKGRDDAIYSSFSDQRATGADDVMSRLFSGAGDAEGVRSELAAKLQLANQCMDQMLKKGGIKKENKALLRAAFRDDEELYELLNDDARLRTRENGSTESEEDRNFEIYAILKAKATFLTQLIEAADGGKKINLEASLDAASLPPKEHSDRFLRYENAIKRQLYRALERLEVLQQRRRERTPVAPSGIQ